MAIVEEMNSFHTYAFPNAKSIIVCGDIHGEFNAVIYKLCIQYQMTELLPETIQEGHGRHSLCNSFRSFPPNTFGEEATSETRRRRRAQGRRTPRCGSSGEPRLASKSEAVGWNLGAIFKKRQSPGEEDDQNERPARRDLHLLKLQMAVPRECHKYVG